jgi:hypothetical protein
MIGLPLLLLATLGAALLAPFVAGHAVLLAERGDESRLASWFGLTIGAEFVAAFPLGVLVAGIHGPAEWPFYYLAYPFALLSLLLGKSILRAHARRLRGEPRRQAKSAYACIGFATLLALALLPWILGAPMPIGAGEFAAEQAVAGSARAYAAVVLPVASALTAEAWLLAGKTAAPGGRRPLELATAALAMLLAFALAILPRSPWNSRHVAARERALLRARAVGLDEPRAQALAAIVAGRVPRLLSQPCLATPAAWRGLARFAEPPRSLEALWEASRAWRGQRTVDLRLAEAAAPTSGSPLRQAVVAALDEEMSSQPWPERDWLVSAEEARRRTRALVGAAPWNTDGTLMVARETPSFASYGKSNLGFVHATLWLWSYEARAFICAGEARVPHQTLEGMFDDSHAEAVREALHMRALAVAITDLRSVILLGNPGRSSALHSAPTSHPATPALRAASPNPSRDASLPAKPAGEGEGEARGVGRVCGGPEVP